MDYNNLCFRCFSEISEHDKNCPNCGYNRATPPSSLNCIKPGTLLHNRYVIGVALGVGGFGITYKCYDTQIGGICAIKEYFPSIYAQRSGDGQSVNINQSEGAKFHKIMVRFVEEAELLKTIDHRNIIKVYDNFFDNNTAYYVMEYCDGEDLRRFTNNFKRKLEYNEGINILYQVMSGLEYVHNMGILHRDIAPDNIFIAKNQSVKILDFGSARREMSQLNSALSVIVKMGYAPVEQYGGTKKQGPYTDIYALGATFYNLFTSIIPLESTQRVVEDSLVPISELRPDLPYNMKYCIEKAMAIKIEDRIGSIAEMRSILESKNLENTSQSKGMENFTSPNPSQQQSYQSQQQSYQSQQQSYQPPPKPIQSNLAPIKLRVMAYIIDFGLYALIYAFILIMTGIASIFSPIMWLIFMPVFMLINMFWEIIASATIGKASMSLRVRSKNNEKANVDQIMFRNIIKVLGVFVVIFSKNGELLDDILTDSRVYCIK